MFPCCRTRDDLSIDASITNVGLISTKLGRFLLSGWDKIQFRQFRPFLKNNSTFWALML